MGMALISTGKPGKNWPPMAQALQSTPPNPLPADSGYGHFLELIMTESGRSFPPWV